MDLSTGVSTLQAIHSQTDARTVDCTALHIQRNGCAAAAGAGNGEHTLVFRVQIDQLLALKHAQVNAGSAIHAGLFIHSDDHFQRRMGNGSISHQGHGVSKGNAVIAAEGCSLGRNAVAIMGHIQTFGSHINGAIGILLADHIHMALQDHRLMVLHAAGAVLKDDHIVQIILNITQTMLLCKADQIVTDHLGVAGAVGNGADFFKISKYRSRLKTCQFNRIHSSNSFIWDDHILPQKRAKVHPHMPGKK